MSLFKWSSSSQTGLPVIDSTTLQYQLKLLEQNQLLKWLSQHQEVPLEPIAEVVPLSVRIVSGKPMGVFRYFLFGDSSDCIIPRE